MLVKSLYLCDIYKQNCMEISHWYHFDCLNIWNGSEIPEENVKWYCSGCKIFNQDPPQWNSPCCGEGAYPPGSSNQSASMRRAQQTVTAKVIRPADLLNNVKI